MPRDIPVGNGQMLVTFDRDYQIRDLYFPHVGQENHTTSAPCRFGVWGLVPQTQHTQGDRRKRRLFWSNQGWKITLSYLADTLATDARLMHDEMGVELRCSDVVDFHRPLLVRRIEVINHRDEDRMVKICHHNNFAMFGNRVGDTAYYDPMLRSLIHYHGNRYLMAGWYADGEQRMDEFATGMAGFLNAEGTWRDAEDGKLGNNTIAQGAVDSTMMIQVDLPGGGAKVVYMVVGAGHNHQDMEGLHQFLHREGPQGVIDRTTAYWRLWVAATRTEFPDPVPGIAPGHNSLPERMAELFKRSLLVVRTQIDNSGAIIAANDTDIMQFSRDTYSYCWPRDGALTAAALDGAGFSDVARSFYSLCSKLITEQGYFLHKYNPDGSPASSWHPWVSLGNPQLPIQEDETALLIWALWRHYLLFRDIEFVRPLWVNLVTKAADFLVRFRDPDTHLPLPGYNLWEDSWGVHAYTVAAVHAGLQAAWQFAVCFGDSKRAEAYAHAAQEIKTAFCAHFWSEREDRFLRRIVPLNHSRTARFMALVMAGRTPLPEGAGQLTASRLADNGHNGHGNGNGNSGYSKAHGNGNGKSNGKVKEPATVSSPLAFEFDPIVDSSMAGISALGLLPAEDPRVVKTMQAIERVLWVRTKVGGLARYEGDGYHRISDHADSAVPGNPWIICTLWLADWYIARAQNVEELQKALPIFDWVAQHALPSGILPEQVHPYTHAPLSVSPLTWSHAAVVSSTVAYLHKLESMDVCVTCGQPRQAYAGDKHRYRPRENPLPVGK